MALWAVDGYDHYVIWLLTIGVFAICMTGLAVGILFSNRGLRGSCGGAEVVGGESDAISCGACPKQEAEICPSDDTVVRLAQIAHPNPRDHHG